MEQGIDWTKIDSYIPTYFWGNPALLKLGIPKESWVDVQVRGLLTDQRRMPLKDSDSVSYLGLEALLDRLLALEKRSKR